MTTFTAKFENTLATFLKTLEEYNLQAGVVSASFPCEHGQADVGLYLIIQESVFSSCGDTLTQRRRRLVDNPDLLEAVTIFRLVISYDNKNRALGSLKL